MTMKVPSLFLCLTLGLVTSSSAESGDGLCGIPRGVSPCTYNDKFIRVDGSATTAEECAPICRGEPDCKSYAAGPGGCWLYSGHVDTCKGQAGSETWTYSDRDCYPTKSTCGTPRGASPCTHNENFIKVDSSATTAKECAPICRAEAKCKSYASGPGGCWLYSREVDICKGAAGSSTWKYSNRDCYPSGPTCDRSGGASPCTQSDKLITRDSSASTPEECAPICRAKLDCKSYAAGPGGCWLYSGDVDTCEGETTSGSKDWSYSDRECFAAKPKCDRPGGASPCTQSDKFIKVDGSASTAEKCAPICRANHDCRSYAAGPGGCWLYSGSVDTCEGVSGSSTWSYSDRECHRWYDQDASSS